jgi:vitamin K-dependent gamma-carboxylase
MVIDVVEERGLADVDIKWGEPWDCHFPLIHGMIPPPLPWMIMLYAVMWMGAFGIALGLHFKIACACFVLPYWYIFLLDKSYWNNHTYLYGIVASLFWGTQANKYL